MKFNRVKRFVKHCDVIASFFLFNNNIFRNFIYIF